MTILSPITNKPAKKILSIDASEIIKNYQLSFNLDVSNYFQKHKTIDVFECNETKYRFYHPFGLEGDSKFYEHLQQYDWYYMPWKWEHQQVAKLLEPNINILEIGCAKGDFLEKLNIDYQVNVTGLELNESVTNNNITILNETIQEHSRNNIEKYDAICSFQVLEHITDVTDFINAQLICLKKGGKLIFSVPNNQSFIKYDFENDILNMPPHHMGLWDKHSLKNLQNIFNIKLINIYYEPLQKYHNRWYRNILLKRFGKSILFIRLYHYLKVKHLINFFITHFNFMVKGHTILAIYDKK